MQFPRPGPARFGFLFYDDGENHGQGAYSIPSETGLLIPSAFASQAQRESIGCVE